MNTQERLKELDKLQKRKDYVRKCLSHNKCPDCFGKLSSLDWGNGYDIVCNNAQCGTTMMSEPRKILGITISDGGLVKVPKTWDTIC